MIKSESFKRCNICDPEDPQIYVLLNNLVVLILRRKKMKTGEPKDISESFYMQKYEGSLQKLLKFMFAEKIMEERSDGCKHEFLQQYLESKTHSNKRELDICAENIYQFQVKRNFELEVLNSQVKCFTKTIIQEVLMKNQEPSSTKNFTQQNRTSIKLEPAHVTIQQKSKVIVKAEEYQPFYYMYPVSEGNQQMPFYPTNSYIN